MHNSNSFVTRNTLNLTLSSCDFINVLINYALEHADIRNKYCTMYKKWHFAFLV